ncbi:hypothetical protein CR513_43497, partial [Mucuna pruriens]
MEVKKNQNFRKVRPPNATPRKNTTTNGKIDRSIHALLTHLPLNKMKIARFTTFHPLDRKPNLFKLLATNEWQLQMPMWPMQGMNHEMTGSGDHTMEHGNRALFGSICIR